MALRANGGDAFSIGFFKLQQFPLVTQLYFLADALIYLAATLAFKANGPVSFFIFHLSSYLLFSQLLYGVSADTKMCRLIIKWGLYALLAFVIVYLGNLVLSVLSASSGEHTTLGADQVLLCALRQKTRSDLKICPYQNTKPCFSNNSSATHLESSSK